MLFSDTQEFLRLLDPTAKNFLFTCFFPQNLQPTDREPYRPRIVVGNFAENEHLLESYNKQGYGIYVTVNECKGRERTNHNIIRPRAIFQDDDNYFHGEYPLQPNIVVHTSQGKYQRYWLIDPESLKDFKGNIWQYWEDMQRVLVHKYGNDKSVHDRARVLRLPGFCHTKDGLPSVTKVKPIQYEIVNEVPYSFHDLVAAFHPSGEMQTYNNESYEAKQNKLIIAMNNILSGDNFNDSLGTLSMHFINKKYPEQFTIALLKGLMLQSAHIDTQRWKDRYEHIPRQVAAGYKKTMIENEDHLIILDDLNSVNYRFQNLPVPSGFLKVLADDIYKSMYYPEMNIAILGAMHILFTFGGRQYTFNGQGLIYKHILLAPPGRGKNAIGGYIKSVVTALEEQFKINEAQFFRGSPDFTSAALIHNELAMWGCRSFIRYEAGMAKQSTAGDIGSLNAYMLQLLGSSYDESIRVKAQRLKPGDHTGPLFNVSVAMIDESVPSSYIAALSDDSFASGDMARVDLIFADPTLHFINEASTEHKPSQEVIMGIMQLVKNSLKLRSPRGADRVSPDNVVHAMTSQEGQELLKSIEHRIFNLRNATIDSPIENSTYQRYVQKLFRLCLMQSVGELATGNTNSPAADKSIPYITVEQIKWADEYLSNLSATIMKNMSSGVFEDATQKAINEFHLKIQGVLTGEYKIEHKQPPELLQHQILARSVLFHNANQWSSFRGVMAKQKKDLNFVKNYLLQIFIREGYLRPLTIDETRDYMANIGKDTNRDGKHGGSRRMELYKYCVKINTD